MATEEEARALAWQADQVKRAAFVRRLQIARRGSAAAYMLLLTKTEPLRRALLEANNGSDGFDGYDSDECNS